MINFKFLKVRQNVCSTSDVNNSEKQITVCHHTLTYTYVFQIGFYVLVINLLLLRF